MNAQELRTFITAHERIGSPKALAEYLGMSLGQVSRAQKRIALLGLTSRRAQKLDDAVLEVLYSRGHSFQPNWEAVATEAIEEHTSVTELYTRYRAAAPEDQPKLGRTPFVTLLTQRVNDLAPLSPTEVVTATLQTGWVGFYEGLITFKNARDFIWNPVVMALYDPEYSRLHLQVLQADTPRFWMSAMKSMLSGLTKVPVRWCANPRTAFFQSLDPEWVRFIEFYRLKIVESASAPLTEVATESHLRSLVKHLITSLPELKHTTTIAEANALIQTRLKVFNEQHHFKRLQTPHSPPIPDYAIEAPLVAFEEGVSRLRLVVNEKGAITVSGYEYPVPYIRVGTMVDCYIHTGIKEIRGFIGADAEVLNAPYPPSEA